jgi:2-polyprenyl-3-methyl-5-hydroxy-6-metoxy-1,4-benzoquinol methylase
MTSEPCPLCKSERVGVKYHLTGYRIAECLDCGLEYHDNFQGGGDTDEMFSEDYYRNVQHEAFSNQFTDYAQDASAKVYERWLSEMAKRVTPGRILDVGSALGTFLKLAEARGWTPEGVEISRFAATFARESRNLSIFNGDLKDFQCPNESFDAITFWDSLEHVTHPQENLKKATRLLRKGGLVLLTTDNFDCLIADIARLAYHLSHGRIRYPMERVFIPHNRCYFTEATLRGLVKASGLRVTVFEKMEYPLEKIRTSAAERLILRCLYTAAAILKRQAQVTILAEKP